MPPRVQPHRQQAEENEPSDTRSDQASSPMPRDRGRGRVGPKAKVEAAVGRPSE